MKDDLLIMGGIALAILGVLWYVKKSATDALDNIVKGTNDAIFGEGQNIDSVIPLYNKELKQRPADYDPGSIYDGAIF
ncbi:hypothetical protein [Duganella qianjiadongensis]|uniref:Uncharacterized protein n=1 Tax=Duganella qianjiadongensis TaxID=2692176 RepID=A0ABW9VJ87_9BURK|nr:hypothetical protein [Duganella qianjiadongensis]MYM39666.1 hypothetical protein [Duganella qianjiadongensis]